MAFIITGVLLGAGLSLVAAGLTMEDYVVNSIAYSDTHCTGNCTAPASAPSWPEYQQGASFMASGAVLLVGGIAFASVGAFLWLRKGATSPPR